MVRRRLYSLPLRASIHKGQQRQSISGAFIWLLGLANIPAYHNAGRCDGIKFIELLARHFSTRWMLKNGLHL